MENLTIEKIEKNVIKIINEIKNIDNLNPLFYLNDLKFEDLDYIELCLELEEEYEIFLDEEYVSKLEKIKNLIDYVFEKINK